MFGNIDEKTGKLDNETLDGEVTSTDFARVRCPETRIVLL